MTFGGEARRDTQAPGETLILEPVAALVLGPPREVELLLVGGRAVVEDGELRTADEAQVAIDIERASRRLAERTVPSL